ncbi:hypothetical protein GOP47_0027167 [Adiantum capillus-veneris]|nr:hypothetical protein GOP47_0027167 [Adiantum capillus-veneris]
MALQTDVSKAHSGNSQATEKTQPTMESKQAGSASSQFQGPSMASPSQSTSFSPPFYNSFPGFPPTVPPSYPTQSFPGFPHVPPSHPTQSVAHGVATPYPMYPHHGHYPPPYTWPPSPYPPFYQPPPPPPSSDHQ